MENIPGSTRLAQLDRQIALIDDELDALQQELVATHSQKRRDFLRGQILAARAERRQASDSRIRRWLPLAANAAAQGGAESR